MTAVPATVEIDRPLGVGELLAVALRIFSGRAWTFIGLGVLQAGALVAAAFTPIAAAVAILAAAFTVAFAMAARLLAGDSLAQALPKTARSAPVLLPLGLVVAVPFYLGSAWLLSLIFAIGWLALTGFAIPVAMIEDAGNPTWSGRVLHALRRTLALARAQYLHAIGVAAALVVIYVLVGVVLTLALNSFADNGRVAAQALAQIVLAPFFFIGLGVLYFEQSARALGSTGPPPSGRA